MGWKRVWMGQGFMPLPTHSQRLCHPVSLVFYRTRPSIWRWQSQFMEKIELRNSTFLFFIVHFSFFTFFLKTSYWVSWNLFELREIPGDNYACSQQSLCTNAFKEAASLTYGQKLAQNREKKTEKKASQKLTIGHLITKKSFQLVWLIWLSLHARTAVKQLAIEKLNQNTEKRKIKHLT